MNVTERLIIALDGLGHERAFSTAGTWARSLDTPMMIKIGYDLIYDSTRPVRDLVHAAERNGVRVMFDAKLHDVPSVVTLAARHIANMGVRYLTVHAYPQTVQAALEGVTNTDTQVLAVTVLTSMTDDDLRDAGYTRTMEALVSHRVARAVTCGAHGLVMSANDLARPTVRAAIPSDRIVVTPGIRAPDAPADDQRRTATAAQAIERGATHIVVGRPITAHVDPRKATRGFVHDIERGLAARATAATHLAKESSP